MTLGNFVFLWFFGYSLCFFGYCRHGECSWLNVVPPKKFLMGSSLQAQMAEIRADCLRLRHEQDAQQKSSLGGFGNLKGSQVTQVTYDPLPSFDTYWYRFFWIYQVLLGYTAVISMHLPQLRLRPGQARPGKSIKRPCWRKWKTCQWRPQWGTACEDIFRAVFFFFIDHRKI